MSRKSEREAAERAAKVGKKLDDSYGDVAGKAPHKGASVGDASTYRDRNVLRNLKDGFDTFRKGR